MKMSTSPAPTGKASKPGLGLAGGLGPPGLQAAGPVMAAEQLHISGHT